MNKEELKILEILDSLIRQKHAITILDSTVTRVEHKLMLEPEALLAWEPVPLSIYGGKLPDTIQSSWVFVLRAGATTGAERHPNSHQRMISYRGSGDLQTWNGKRWCSHILVSDTDSPIKNRCLSIPSNIWHQAVVPQDNWVVIGLHTVPADELIEERQDQTDATLTHQRRYLEKQR
jgi:hypothetical protein